MKKIALFCLLAVALFSCSNERIDKFEGVLHPTNPKLANIQVLDKSSVESDNMVEVKYYSYTDTTFHYCYVHATNSKYFIIGDNIINGKSKYYAQKISDIKYAK